MSAKSKVQGAYISPAMRRSREAKRKAAAAKRKKDLATKAKAAQATKKKAIASKVGPNKPQSRSRKVNGKQVISASGKKDVTISGKAKKVAPAKKKRAAKTTSFGSAFAAARKAGKKAFTWKGKSYHTRTKEEEAKRKKKK